MSGQININKKILLTPSAGNENKLKSFTDNFGSWGLFLILSIIWGSSFILMKGGLIALSAIQVASLRILFAALILLPWAIKYLKTIPRQKILMVLLSGILGSLLPAYLFCIAEQKIDSGIAGTLNSLTPLFVMITGVIFFKTNISSKKILGIIIAFLGSILLLYGKGGIDYKNNIGYGLLILLATLSYGLNANLVHRFLSDIGSLKIASVALVLCSFPALIILYTTGFFRMEILDSKTTMSLVYTAILGIFGTAFANILYYKLLKRSGAVFSSMVTYCIPVVANIWGIIFGERIGLFQFACMVLILLGVYTANVNFNFRVNFFFRPANK